MPRGRDGGSLLCQAIIWAAGGAVLDPHYCCCCGLVWKKALGNEGRVCVCALRRPLLRPSGLLSPDSPHADLFFVVVVVIVAVVAVRARWLLWWETYVHMSAVAAIIDAWSAVAQ
ncbi:unnamed protein product [Laminaria digitata]